MKRVAIFGTAGHVDHGKTELIRALTGINADRWREEQERGITLDLGFAYMDLPSGRRAAIVDVPGHERFVHNMLAGAAGIDVALLVVAADEGVMPQTREHVAILDLLDVGPGIVVVTKADRADEETIAVVREEAADLLAGTSLAGVPAVVTSAVTGLGLSDLVAAMDAAAGEARPHDIQGPARMPVDRSFTLAGHGTVVTGSLLRGRLRVGQSVEIIPAGLRGRVRRLEAHGEHLDEVAAPARVGVNLADLARDQVARGDQLVEPDSMGFSRLLDVELRLLGSARRPLRQRAPVHVHLAAAEAVARVVLLGGVAELLPGATALAQLVLDRPLACAAGDRFVLRSYSPVTTIGGGAVLDPRPRRHRAAHQEVAAALEALRSASPVERVAELLRGRGKAGATADEVRQQLQLAPDQVADLLSRAADAGLVASLGDRYVHADILGDLADDVTAALAAYHAAHPAQAAMPMRELQTSARLPAAALDGLLRVMAEGGQVAIEAGGARLASHRAGLAPADQALADRALAAIRSAGLQPPAREQVIAALGGGGAGRDLLAYLAASGAVVVAGGLVLAAEAVERAREALAARFAGRAFTVADARDALGSTRKYVVPLLEHLDRSGFTLRQGDDRRLRA